MTTTGDWCEPPCGAPTAWIVTPIVVELPPQLEIATVRNTSATNPNDRIVLPPKLIDARTFVFSSAVSRIRGRIMCQKVRLTVKRNVLFGSMSPAGSRSVSDRRNCSSCGTMTVL